VETFDTLRERLESGVAVPRRGGVPFASCRRGVGATRDPFEVEGPSKPERRSPPPSLGAYEDLAESGGAGPAPLRRAVGLEGRLRAGTGLLAVVELERREEVFESARGRAGRGRALDWDCAGEAAREGELERIEPEGGGESALAGEGPPGRPVGRPGVDLGE
jgi:hypothetical protein